MREQGKGFSPFGSFSDRDIILKQSNGMCLEQMADMNNAQGQPGAAQQLAASGAGSATTSESSGVGKGGDDEDEVPELLAPEDDSPVDETGVDPKDIELVMLHAVCSRAKAVRVLKECDGDLINASVSIFIGIRDPTSDFLFSPLVMAACE